MLDALLRRRPSHATLVAYLALFVALGGSSYAALRVGSGQIVNNSVRSKDIRNNDVRSTDVRNRSLLAQDFKSGQLPAGARGPAGAPGQDGRPGRDAASMLTGSAPTNFMPPLAGGQGAFTLPPSGVAAGGGSGIQLSPNATVVARDLSVKITNAPPANAALRFTLSVNDVLTALRCTVQAGTATCQDGANAVTIPPNSEITLVVDNPGSANTTATGGRWALRATTP